MITLLVHFPKHTAFFAVEVVRFVRNPVSQFPVRKEVRVMKEYRSFSRCLYCCCSRPALLPSLVELKPGADELQRMKAMASPSNFTEVVSSR